MTPEKLSELAHQIGKLIADSGIEAEKFNVSLLVTRQFYESIKHNFTERPEIDIVIGQFGDDWAIQLMYTLQM